MPCLPSPTSSSSLSSQEQAGCPVSTAEPRFKDRKVVDLMETLRRSLGAAPPKAAAETAAKAKKAKRPKKRVEGQREMLLPIAGKAPLKVPAAKKPAAPSRPSRKTG